MKHSKSICVYCSSSESVDSAFTDQAVQLGAVLAEKGYSLVYGGGEYGLMGKLAASVQENGGRVIGVIPEALMLRAYIQADELIVTKDMRKRKAAMESRADAFITLPGGFGTLEELLEIITLKQLQFHQKAIVIVNTLGFFDHLLEQFEHSYESQFAHPAFRQLYHVTRNVLQAVEYIEGYVPANLPSKYKHWERLVTEEQKNMENKFRYAIELITGDSSLTDDMDDDQASRLLTWGEQQARRLASKSAGIEVEEELDTNLQNLRRVMRRINKLVGMLDFGEPEEMSSILSKIFEAAADVPAIKALPPDDLDEMVAQLKSLPRGEALEMIMSRLLGESDE
jgi:uncharacterized protein (TIGR00730 family)